MREGTDVSLCVCDGSGEEGLFQLGKGRKEESGKGGMVRKTSQKGMHYPLMYVERSA